MPRCTNTIVGILNVFVFISAIPLLCTGVYLSLNGSTQCARFIDKPIILLGAFLMIVSLAGIIGSCCKVTWLLWFYQILMFFGILLFFCFTVFSFAITSKGAGESIPGKAYKEYRLEGYSKWMQKRVSHVTNWNNIKSCLLESPFCTELEKVSGNASVSDFNKRPLTSLQSGCCKPSNDCNFVYITPTNWNKTTTSETKNLDCQIWDGTDKKKLCYDCQACKAGFVDSVKSELKSVLIGNVFFLVFLVVVWGLGWRIIRNNKMEELYGPPYKL